MDGTVERRGDKGLSEAMLEAAHQSAARRRLAWGRRAFSPAVRLLMWGLRLYVLVMVVIVGVQLARLA